MFCFIFGSQFTKKLVSCKLNICCELLYKQHVKLPLHAFFISNKVGFMYKLHKMGNEGHTYY
jgi:hypothetical protein